MYIVNLSARGKLNSLFSINHIIYIYEHNMYIIHVTTNTKLTPRDDLLTMILSLKEIQLQMI